ncbi:NlpC/P60 family protein [Virgibacillus sp. YIM 98842]|uniref:C40 family peptidase n=1 Tax=Virgibacillus sp. YIM 98842 TaxID=2663533 RepID=UPI0013D9E1BE|nr:NlpC/P60 family protein [Virgibacillus sp. YIM 98842]
MINGTVEHVVKKSVLYSYVLSQPLVLYVDAYPELQNEILLKSEQLQYGEHGESVRILQLKLKKLSYYNDEIDGDFGLLTEHALKKIQSEHYLASYGQADKDTIRTIIKMEKERYLKQVEQLSESIYPGMHGEDVKIVQKALQYFGYYEGELDGIFGPLTKKALEIAEEEHGIELSEEVTRDDLASLYESGRDENDQSAEGPENTEVNQDAEEVNSTIEEKDQQQEKEIKKAEVTASYSQGAVEEARAMIGSPYVWGGESPGGFDCSGLIQYIFQTQNITIPRTVSEVWNFAEPVDSPSIGDLVFFETYKPGPSHMGIYIGNGEFIHAGESSGVDIGELSNSYWETRYLGAKRIIQE